MHGKLITTTLWYNDQNLHAQNAQLSWLVWFNKLAFDNLHAKAGEQNFIYHVGSLKYIMHAHRVQLHGHFSPMKDFLKSTSHTFALVKAQCIRILAMQNSVGHALWSTDCLSS